MRCQTSSIETGFLAEVNLVELGARTGLFWSSNMVVLVGFGLVESIEVDLLDGAGALSAALMARGWTGSPGEAGVGPVGFAALPFDRSCPGTAQIPSLAIVERDGRRFLTHPEVVSITEVEREVRSIIDADTDLSPPTITLDLDRSADRWRDDVVQVARDLIAASPLEKVVLPRQLTLQANADFVVAPLVEDLYRRFSHANVFSIDGFIGASPELLVSRDGRTVRAHPLAGTATRKSDDAEDAAQVAALLSSGKDRIEHQITIDWLLAELLPYCSYVDAEPEPSIVTLANVHHLGTLVEGVLSEPAASILDLVAAVHPTPAVGGNPQGEALRIIADLEGFDRQRYAGPAGWLDVAGNGEFAVSVRTAQIQGSTATIAAGVGVVAQSDPEDELLETQAKLRAMLETFLRQVDGTTA